ncbi:MAG: DUF1573 domain-containing protein [Bacteroidetes bacterium]|nr:DUF1573 domain-containing protein [Bacteroidota bacterium]
MKKTISNKLSLLLGILVLFSANILNAQPSAVLLEKEKSWGDVHYQVALTTDIHLYNAGKDTLKILDVRPGCGCTTVPGYPENIAPGDTATIAVDLNIKTFSGQITKSVTITTNDPQNYRLVYLLKCNVIRPFVIVPRYISFDKLYINELATTKTQIKNTSKATAKIKDIIIERSNLKVNLKPGDEIKPDETFELETSITPDKLGHIHGKIKILIDHPDEEFIELSAYGRVIEHKNKE